MRKAWLPFAAGLLAAVLIGCASDTGTGASAAPTAVPESPAQSASEQSEAPTETPTLAPAPTDAPTAVPTEIPTETPTSTPAPTATIAPTAIPVPTATLAPTATPVSTATPVPPATPMPVVLEVAAAVIGDPAHLIGDNFIGTSAKNGWVYSCTQNFGGPITAFGDWVVGDFWHPARKLSVQGEVNWPSAQVSFEIINGRRVISGNGLPVGHPTGTYPISSSDPAREFDDNPGTISAQVVEFSLPLNPTLAATPTCLDLGTIAVALNGVSVYNGIDGAGRDAPAYEILGLCTGHPQSDGTYHYHAPGACQKEAHTLGHTLTAYALDGFGLFGLYDGQGQEITNADLDECHGHTHDIDWDGATINMFHYHLTNAFPYTIGCYRGSEVVAEEATQSGPPGGGGPGPGGGPPPPPPGY